MISWEGTGASSSDGRTVASCPLRTRPRRRPVRCSLFGPIWPQERELIPFLRDAKAFPSPPNDEAAAMYAQGFAWAMQGIAPDVIERVRAMLPENLCTQLQAALAAFDARCERVWGPLKAGAARTPIPDPRGE